MMYINGYEFVDACTDCHLGVDRWCAGKLPQRRPSVVQTIRSSIMHSLPATNVLAQLSSLAATLQRLPATKAGAYLDCRIRFHNDDTVVMGLTP